MTLQSCSSSMSRIDECTVAHKGSAMGIDCLTKAMGYDRALDKPAAGLVHQIFCNPRCESVS
jgi:hypothetical protein